MKWGDGMRLIDADKFIDWLDVGHLRSPSETCFSEGDVKVMIDIQPTIEAVPVVHAEWKMRGGKLYCTNCGKKALEEKDRDDWHGCERSNFCPHCGADIRKKV